MHWGSSLFLLFCILLVLPLRLQFTVEHQKYWDGTVTLKFLFFHYTKHFSHIGAQKTESQQAESIQEKQALSANLISSDPITPLLEEDQPKSDYDTNTETKSKKRGLFRRRQRQQHIERSFQAHWKAVATFAIKVLHIVAHKLRLEQLSLYCRIGLSEPSWTAYCYGFFWTAISVLPLDKIKEVDVEYIPEFQQQRQEINLQGIISCRFGQLIHILFSVLWLVVKMTLEQNRKEKMVYEN